MNTAREEEIFHEYLRTIWPMREGHTYKVERLNGGMVNYVYRIQFQNENNEQPQSVILKHYQPYLASDPVVPLSCERYFVEKNALQSFATNQTDSGPQPQHGGSLKIPKLVHFHDEHHLLEIEDCGSSISSLFEVFQTLKTAGVESAVSVLDYRAIVSRIVTAIRTLEDRLRAFSKDFFSPKLLQEYFSKGTNEMIEGYVYQEYSARVRSLPPLQKYISMVEGSRLRRQSLVQQLLTAEQLPQNYQLIFGDLWPNAVFLQTNSLDHSEVIILDWEFAHFEHQYNDYFQLLAYLFLMEFDDQYHIPAVQYFKQSILDIVLKRDDITKDNLSLFLCDIALVINEDRWRFIHHKVKICEEVAAFVEMMLEKT